MAITTSNSLSANPKTRQRQAAPWKPGFAAWQARRRPFLSLRHWLDRLRKARLLLL